MSDAHGCFIWYELLASDADAAQRFYGDVVGWSVEDSGQQGADYRLFKAPDGAPVGGLMTRPEGMPGGPLWLGYVAVDDVDAAVSAVEEKGGALRMPAIDIPDVGRLAMVADPQGAPLYVMRGTSAEPSRAFVQGDRATPGHAVWNELTAPDPDAAIDFYAGTFGWRREGSMPMGELGEYRFVHVGPTCLGAVTGQTPDGRDGWQFYFLVPELDAATERLKAGGGKVIQGPEEIPGGGFSLIAEDPQGARFGLVGPGPRDA